MLRIGLASVLLFGVSAVAVAEESTESTFKPDAYIGAGTGRIALNANIPGVAFDAHDNGWQIMLGGRINPNMSLEVGYVDGGSVRDVVSGVPMSIDPRGFLGSFIASVPISDAFGFHARVGAMKWDANGNIGGLRTKDDGTDIVFGGGASMRVKLATFRLDWQRMGAEDFDAELLTFSVLVSL